MRPRVWILAALAAAVFMPGTAWAQEDEKDLKRWFENKRAELEKQQKKEMQELERRFKEKLSGLKKPRPKVEKKFKIEKGFRVGKKFKVVKPLHDKNEDWKFCPWCGHTLKGKPGKSTWKYVPKKAEGFQWEKNFKKVPGKNFEFKYVPDKGKYFYKEYKKVPGKSFRYRFEDFKKVPGKKKFEYWFKNNEWLDNFDFEFEGMEFEKLKELLKKLKELPRRDDDDDRREF